MGKCPYNKTKQGSISCSNIPHNGITNEFRAIFKSAPMHEAIIIKIFFFKVKF